MRRSIIALAIACAAGAALGTALLATRALELPSPAAPPRTPLWTEVVWPFPADQFGKGKAFHCQAKYCGSEVLLYLRAKIGFCDCLRAIDDDEVDRVGDIDLFTKARDAVGPGRPIAVRWMQGRSRGYVVPGSGPAKSALAVAFHDRCDMIVATAAISADKPMAIEEPVLEFLNSDRVLRWAEVTVGF
jgi:hypothetical protein